MYDGLTARYTLSCPRRGEARVRLSSFRRLEQLPGAAHPAVFEVRFSCTCGDEHPALVSHDDLDWAPLGTGEGAFYNLMTSQTDRIGDELLELAAARIQAGEWPWTFYCYLEERPRPVFPSAFAVLSPGERSLGVAVRCPVCGSLSVNIVSSAHVDLPFHHDREIGVVPHVFEADAERIVAEFRAELDSAAFEARRLDL